MIRYVKGNIFDSKAQVLVNPCNCQGVAGAGLSLKFKELFPENFNAYRAGCLAKDVMVGEVYPFRVGTRWIVNLPTKNEWKYPSRLGWIDGGLNDLSWWAEAEDIKSIAIPALGCGLGGLAWEDVRSLIERNLSDTDCDIEVYEP